MPQLCRRAFACLLPLLLLATANLSAQSAKPVASIVVADSALERGALAVIERKSTGRDKELLTLSTADDPGLLITAIAALNASRRSHGEDHPKTIVIGIRTARKTETLRPKELVYAEYFLAKLRAMQTRDGSKHHAVTMNLVALR